jgi:hypothetical protein
MHSLAPGNARGFAGEKRTADGGAGAKASRTATEAVDALVIR